MSSSTEFHDFKSHDVDTLSTFTDDIGSESQEISKPSQKIKANTIVVDNYAPDPNRAVYLLTQDRRQQTDFRVPSRRIIREINRSRLHLNNRRRLESVYTVEEEEIRNLGPHTDEFNDYLKKHQRLSENTVEMVINRMKTNNIDMNTETYNLLLEMVANVPGPMCYNIYDDFRKNVKPPTTEPNVQTYRLLFLSCERNNDFDKVFHYYNQMRLIPNLLPDAAFYNTLLTYCLQLRDETKAAFLVEEMKEQNIEPDVHTYNSLLNIFADAPYEVQFKTFEDMLRRKVKPNRRTYNSLMRSCQRSGDYERAFQFFEELKSDGLQPDVITYNIVFVLCHDRLDSVLGGAHHAVIRNREHHEVTMKAVGELFMAIFAEMEVCNVLPNTFTYNALLRGLSRCNDIRVYDVFTQMKQDCRKTETDPMDELIQTWMTGNADICSSLPMLLPPINTDNENKPEDLEEASMTGKGSSPNLESYKTMIDAAKGLGMPEKSCAFYDEMRAIGIRPNKAAISLMLEVCAFKRDKERAYATLDDAKDCGIRLDVDIINGLMNVLAECGDQTIFDELDRLNKDDGSLDVKPNIETYNLALKGCLKIDDLESAMRLYTELCNPRYHLKGPDASTYSILFDICSQCKDFKAANKLMKDMKTRNLPADINAYCRYLNVCVSVRDVSVLDVFDDMKHHGPEPTLEAYKILLSYHLGQRDPVIVQTFNEMKATGIIPDIGVFNIMLDYYGVKEDSNSSLRLFEEIKSMWLSPDIETFNALMKCFAKTGASMVHKIFEEMSDAKVAPDHITFSILAQHKAGFSSLATALEQQLVYMNKPIKY
eukprot:Tbor_TRINITY_DN3382_c0_g1::TRINITY_DN3382_c0_g1_i1::g.23536::m.23536